MAHHVFQIALSNLQFPISNLQYTEGMVFMSSLILHLLEKSDQSLARQDESFIIADRLPICFTSAAFFKTPGSTSLSNHDITAPIEYMYDLKERLRWQEVNLPAQPSVLPDSAQPPQPASFLWY